MAGACCVCLRAKAHLFCTHAHLTQRELSRATRVYVCVLIVNACCVCAACIPSTNTVTLRDSRGFGLWSFWFILACLRKATRALFLARQG